MEIADYEDKALVGRIGLARRTHYLLEVAPTLAAPTWAASACGAWAGGVVLVQIPARGEGAYRLPTCRACMALARPWRVPATQVRPPGAGPGAGVY